MNVLLEINAKMSKAPQSDRLVYASKKGYNAKVF